MQHNISSKIDNLQKSVLPMSQRYFLLTKCQFSNIIYSSFLNEADRITLTRWRLSCHDLRIETGRYQRPFIPRENRLCSICFVLEDETHALFICKANQFIRQQFQNLIIKYPSLETILNPSNIHDAEKIAKYIRDIEKNRTVLKMSY